MISSVCIMHNVPLKCDLGKHCKLQKGDARNYSKLLNCNELQSAFSWENLISCLWYITHKLGKKYWNCFSKVQPSDKIHTVQQDKQIKQIGNI